jgi:hypothetical protein
MTNMENSVATINDVVEVLAEDQRVILQAIFGGTLSCLGSAVALEVRRAAAGEMRSKAGEGVELVEPAKAGEIGFAVEPTEVDTSAYEARVAAVHWVIAHSGAPDRFVRPQADSALEWLKTAQSNSSAKSADLKDLVELGLDADTIAAGRKVAARWDKARSDEKNAIVGSIGPSVVDEVCNVVDAADLKPGELSLVVTMLGKAIHKAMIDGVARVESSSWSARRKAEAVSDLANLTATRDLLDSVEVVDGRDFITADRKIW